MSIQNLFENSGSWLFRFRSYLPLMIIPIVLMAGASYGYLGNSHAQTEWWGLGCLAISLLGQGLRIFTVGYVMKRTSGRNTRCQVAAFLNTTGIYSVVRHPLYLGNYLGLMGFILYFRNGWLAALVTCLFALYYERIMFTEEAYLRGKFGVTFENWAAITPAFIPKLSGWRRAENIFCWRTALRREYTGLFLVVGGFAILNIAADSWVERQWRMDAHWAGVLVGGALTYVVLRTLKKHSSFLSVKGR